MYVYCVHYRADHDTANAQSILDYKQALSEWKVYEKRRVSESASK